MELKCNSATKSFTGILACIALQKGILDSVKQKLCDIFPEYFINHQDKKVITIEDVLAMRSGIVGNNKNDGYNFFMTPYVQDDERWKDNFEFDLYKKVLESCIP